MLSFAISVFLCLLMFARFIFDDIDAWWCATMSPIMPALPLTSDYLYEMLIIAEALLDAMLLISYWCLYMLRRCADVADLFAAYADAIFLPAWCWWWFSMLISIIDAMITMMILMMSMPLSPDWCLFFFFRFRWWYVWCPSMLMMMFIRHDDARCAIIVLCWCRQLRAMYDIDARHILRLRCLRYLRCCLILSMSCRWLL